MSHDAAAPHYPTRRISGSMTTNYRGPSTRCYLAQNDTAKCRTSGPSRTVDRFQPSVGWAAIQSHLCLLCSAVGGAQVSPPFQAVGSLMLRPRRKRIPPCLRGENLPFVAAHAKHLRRLSCQAADALRNGRVRREQIGEAEAEQLGSHDKQMRVRWRRNHGNAF